MALIEHVCVCVSSAELFGMPQYWASGRRRVSIALASYHFIAKKEKSGHLILSLSVSLALPMIESTWYITVVLLQRRGHNCISTVRKRKHYFNWHFSPALELWQDTKEIPAGMTMKGCEELQKWQSVHNNQSNQVGFIKRPRNKTKSAWNSSAKPCASSTTSQKFQGILLNTWEKPSSRYT